MRGQLTMTRKEAMGKIHKLDETIVQRIAAGEVRPTHWPQGALLILVYR